ncbi:MFS transporter [Actinacidiphila glaucinigra]|uniref:MFS transporter n=1 Tax=Actinacidiphila glaucinigra TaxID=235986 RepID=UPI00372375AD
MERGPSLGREFGWLWTAYATSMAGTWFALDAFPLIAIRLLDSSPAQVSLLSAAGLAGAALIAIPLGPWVDRRRKRPVMIGADLLRFAVLLSLPVAHLAGVLTFLQLVLVSIVVAASNVVFTAASGACLKALVRPEHLLSANGRFESTMWTATALGPPSGGLAVGAFGPLVTTVVNAASFLLSAFGIRAMGGEDAPPAPKTARPFRPGDLLDGWRRILGHPTLRLLFFNTTLVNGLIMATAPLLAVLLLRDLGFAPWQYGLAFGVPCLGGLVGSRLSRRLVPRYGQRRVMVASGALRACWLVGLAFVRPGPWGLVLVILVEFGLITCVGVFNPVLATYRLEHSPADQVARVLSAWSVTSSATIAALTASWGLLAAVTGPRTAVAAAGVLILGTAFLLPYRRRLAAPDPVPAADRV